MLVREAVKNTADAIFVSFSYVSEAAFLHISMVCEQRGFLVHVAGPRGVDDRCGGFIEQLGVLLNIYFVVLRNRQMGIRDSLGGDFEQLLVLLKK